MIDEVLDATDLVMLDLKHMRDEIHHDFIGVSNKRTLDFARYLHKIGQKTWIRYVVVPGYTDKPEDAHLLGEFIKEMDMPHDFAHDGEAERWNYRPPHPVALNPLLAST